MLSEREFFKKYLSETAPEGIQLAAGDKVTLTNPQGVVFRGETVLGFADGKVHLKGGHTPYWYGFQPEQLKREATAPKAHKPGSMGGM